MQLSWRPSIRTALRCRLGVLHDSKPKRRLNAQFLRNQALIIIQSTHYHQAKLDRIHSNSKTLQSEADVIEKQVTCSWRRVTCVV
jgi:hypothetical protein